jgi:hypothetical protein
MAARDVACPSSTARPELLVAGLSAPRQLRQATPFASYDRLLLGTRPSFDLTFRSDGVGDAFEMLRKD